MIPGEPDCDYDNGEKIFTEDEVRKYRESYHEHGGIVDEEHTFLRNGREVGEPVEDYLLPGATKMTNIHGEEREYPRGTWVVKSKITDPELMTKAEKGEIAYSPTVIPRQKAIELAAAKGRVLIKDVPDGVVYTLSLTTHPCIDNSCQVGKSDPSIKAGRVLSKQNITLLERAINTVQEAASALNGLIAANKPEINDGGGNMTEKSKDKKDEKEFVTKSDLKAFEDSLVDKIKEAQKADPPKKNPEQSEDGSGGSNPKCPKCGATVKPNDKYCSNCGAQLQKSSKSQDKDKTKSKAIKNHDDGKNDTAYKSIEHYAGRDLKGRPLKNEEKL